MRSMRLAALAACAVLLSACNAWRHREQPAPPPVAVPEPDTSAAASVTDEPPASASDATANAGSADATPPCLPPEEKPKSAKPKPRPKRPVVHQEPPPPPPAPVTEPPANGAVDADLKLLNSAVESVLGKKVEGVKGEDFGRVVDVLADGAGRVRVAIIDYGGFLGVGNRRIAVDWALLRADPEHPDQPLTLRITREKLQSAPAYKESARPPTLMVP